MSGTEGQDPGGTVPIDLQLPRTATGNCREQSTPQSTAPITRLIDTKSLLQVTPYHGDKASFLGWKRSSENLELSDQACTLLASLCKDEACAYVRSAEDGNGSQAWQALRRARTAQNATNILNQLLEPTFTSPDPRINIRRWNKNAEEYATRTGERVSDGIRRDVYMKIIAPQDMRQNLMLNQSRLGTAEEVAQKIEDYWDATEELSRDDKN